MIATAAIVQLGAPTAPQLPWFVTAVIGLTCSTIVSFIMFAYRWADRVANNHLKHIEQATAESAKNTSEMLRMMSVEAAKSDSRHEQTVELLTRR